METIQNFVDRIAALVPDEGSVELLHGDAARDAILGGQIVCACSAHELYLVTVGYPDLDEDGDEVWSRFALADIGNRLEEVDLPDGRRALVEAYLLTDTAAGATVPVLGVR
jgi:hypothetical protein